MATLDDILAIHQPRPQQTVLKEIAKRWSPRYYSKKPVPLSHIKRMFEAARWAPSGHNHQPWYFYYAKRGTASYTKLFATLNDYNQSWAKTAPFLIVACAITKNEKGDNPFALYDLGASVISLILQAQSLGYYARQMGLFDKTKVKNLFSLEKNIEPFVVIALGKIGNYDHAPKEIIDMELDPRPRKRGIARRL